MVSESRAPSAYSSCHCLCLLSGNTLVYMSQFRTLRPTKNALAYLKNDFSHMRKGILQICIHVRSYLVDKMTFPLYWGVGELFFFFFFFWGGGGKGGIGPGFFIENFRDRSQGEKCQDHVKLEKAKKAERENEDLTSISFHEKLGLH